LRGHVVDAGRLAQSLRTIGPAPLAVGLVGAVGVVALQALRCWYITRATLHVRYSHVLASRLVGGLFNAALPARAGDLAQVQFLSDQAHVSRATLLGIDLVDVWADKSGSIAAFVLLLPTGAAPSWMPWALVAGAVLPTALMGVATLARSRVLAAAHGDGWRARFARGLAAGGSYRRALVALGIAALPWLWESASIQLVTRAAGVELAWMHALALLAVFDIATVVPVPAHLGAHEIAGTAVLASFGVSLDRALAIAVVYHASQLLPAVLAGGALMTRRHPATAPS
jgi:uncharacterized membrane protein YbhN (UPF0104 family)